MTPRTKKNSVDDVRHHDATEHAATDAVDVSAEPPHDAEGDVGSDDRDRRAAMRWIHLDDLVVISPRPPARTAASGQRGHDTRPRKQGPGVSGATAPRRSRRSVPRARKRDEEESLSTSPSTRLGPWLDVRGTAEYLAMRERAVRDLWRRGILPGHRFARNVRFGLRELDGFLLRNRQATLDEIAAGACEKRSGPIGPLVSPEQAAAYLGLASVDALIKRTERRQIPVYRVSTRLLRYRLAEFDFAIAGNRLTARGGEPTMDFGACLPTGKEDVE